jgi:hypothetical protein
VVLRNELLFGVSLSNTSLQIKAINAGKQFELGSPHMFDKEE